MEQQQLSTVLSKPGEVEVGGVQEPPHVPHALRVAVEIKGRPVEVGIVVPEGEVAQTCVYTRFHETAYLVLAEGLK